MNQLYLIILLIYNKSLIIINSHERILIAHMIFK
jgi:hypothetical protein